MAKRRKNRERDDNPFEEADEDRRPKRRRKTNTRRRRWPYLLILLLVGLALLPNLVGWTGLHQSLIHYAAKDFNGKLTIERVSLGWMQSLTLSGIKAVDNEGQELLTVDQVTTSQSLIQLLNSQFRTQRFEDLIVTAPTLRLHLRPDGSNLEDAIAKFMPASDPTNPTPANPNAPITLPKFKLQVNEGRALISSSTDDRFWQVDGLTMLFESLSEKAPLSINTQCAVTELNAGADGKAQILHAGKLDLQTEFDPGAPALQLESLRLALNADNLPVSLAGPLAQRFIGPARSTGLLTTKVASNIDLQKSALGVDMQAFSLRDLMLVAPQLIGQDQVQVRNLNANGQLQLSPQMISSNQFEVQTDFGKMKSHGSFDVNQLSQLAEGSLLNEPLELQGDIDLAALVRMLPATFKLHEDLQVDSGVITFLANTKTEGETRRLIFQADAANLKGRRAGQMLVWQNPLKLGGAIRQVGQQLALENLDLQTDFLRLAGSATMESGTFAVKGDLNRMVERVGQFVDLTGIELAGTLDGNLGWQAAEGVSLASNQPMPIQLGGQFQFDQPKIKLPNLPLWQPQQLLVKFTGAGVAQTDATTSTTQLELQTGGARIDIGPENATVVLAAPIKYPMDSNLALNTLNLNCEANGSLQGWLAHLRNFIDLGTLQAGGQMTAKGNLVWANQLLQFKDVKYQAQELAFDGYGMKIRDPEVNGTAEGSFDLNRAEIRLADATLISNAVAARGQNLRIAFADRLQADGGIGFRADVNRLAQWFELSPNADSVHWFGSAEGMLQMVSQEQGVASQVSAKLVDLIAAQQQAVANPQAGQPSTQWVELYRDAQVQLDSQVTLASDFNSIILQSSSIKSSAVNLEASGTVADLSNTLLLDLQGRWNPNWDKVQALLVAYTYGTVGLSGSGTKPFSIRGPLLAAAAQPGAMGPAAWVPAQLEGALAVGWDQGSFLEVPIGASEINIDLKNSIGYVGTRGIPFSGGSIQVAPYVDLRGENPLVVMKPTRVIDNVALSQDTARKWLKYIAPLVADATSAQGNLTMDMESLQMPVFNPLNIEATGTVQMADVVIGAGPLADQLLATVQQVRSLLKPDAGERDLKTWLQLSQQTIPFTIKDQMVYHENVTLKVKDITITTSGSVGFDQSLQMMAEIPIADEWIADKPYLAGLKGQKLRIPISGTVSQPQLDRKAVQGFSAELARAATSGAVNQVVADKLMPKANELQEKLNQKVSGEMNKLQERVGEKMGGVLGQLPGGSLGQLPNFGGLPNLSGAGGLLPAANGILPNTNSILPNTNSILPNTNSILPNANSILPGSPNPVPAAGSGAAEGGAAGSAPATGGTNPLNNLGNSLENELKKGIGDLFNRKK